MSDAIVLTSQQPGGPDRARRSSAPQPESTTGLAGGPAESLVPAGFTFDGVVAFDGRARIDGELRGRVEGRGRLEVGPEGRLVGDVLADELVVSGSVEGELTVSARTELQAGARVRGALRTPALQMHEGAVLDGPCSIDPTAGQKDSVVATNRCAG